MTQAYAQMAGALIFVIILIFAAGFLMRKKQNKFGLMEVISYHSFGPKKGVAALKVGTEVLILGMTQNEMRLLRTFRNGELELPENRPFQNKLQTMMKAKNN
ncbi:MAG: FliO/MopB family protein [Nitrospiraceae bacterium]|nr:MAG: FliO/MopB family protein [Nitrospiraceae bacterium]